MGNEEKIKMPVTAHAARANRHKYDEPTKNYRFYFGNVLNFYLLSFECDFFFGSFKYS